MSYRVLARRWRPQNFDTVVGQPHVVQSLVNALTQQRLHHAYLFTGTRGVGKTSIARILARCLNCTQGVTPTPCDACDTCQAIAEGRFLDLIEIDAASRTKVEDIRELLENIQYAPNQGRYKVYLIDEVHMLSGHSFNALLKTLEEPPPHVIFLLATTDPQKLPITVLSRCLQFNLKRLSEDSIIQQLAHILEAEKIAYEPSALHPLAYTAQGSLRDALSLLDQAIAYTNQSLTLEGIHNLLGHLRLDDLLALLDALLAQEAAAIMQQIKRLNEQGVDFEQVLNDLQRAVHQLTLYQCVPDLIQKNLWGNSTAFKTRVNKTRTQTLQQYYTLMLKGSNYLSHSPSPRSGFEMLMLEMIKPANHTELEHKETKKRVETIPTPTQAPSRTPTQAPTQASTEKVDWATILPSLDISGLTHAIATHCTLDRITQTTLHLTLSPEYQALLTEKQTHQLSEALNAYFNQTRELKVHIGKSSQLTPSEQAELDQKNQTHQVKETLMQDPHVEKLIKEMGGTWVDGSLEPQ